jgi:hypothetical protein
MKTCLVYLDNVITLSSSRKMHLQHANEALNLLGSTGFSLESSKCRLFQGAVDYQGHFIRPGKLAVAKKNTAAMWNAHLQITQTELYFYATVQCLSPFRSAFCGLLAAPLMSHLGKGTLLQFGTLLAIQTKSFNTLLDKLLSPQELALPRTTGKFWLDTDASDGQLGTYLFQEQPDG